MTTRAKGPKHRLPPEDHARLARWAAACAAHILPYFEADFPDDPRPRAAIAACRAWARTGVFRMREVRATSLAAHAAARAASPGSAAQYAARAAGQAAAAPHVALHALGPALYGAKVADVVGLAGERAWQYARLPLDLRPFVRAAAADRPLLARILRYPGLASAGARPGDSRRRVATRGTRTPARRVGC